MCEEAAHVLEQVKRKTTSAERAFKPHHVRTRGAIWGCPPGAEKAQRGRDSPAEWVRVWVPEMPVWAERNSPPFASCVDLGKLPDVFVSSFGKEDENSVVGIK